mmetsp:Transcript_48266/g.145902  ORF Transcript_48266/g.145902 Transcript_48266/m.145902 type:complete len:108 (+) Transcript_48266:287-610(+)
MASCPGKGRHVREIIGANCFVPFDDLCLLISSDLFIHQSVIHSFSVNGSFWHPGSNFLYLKLTTLLIIINFLCSIMIGYCCAGGRTRAVSAAMAMSSLTKLHRGPRP